jgi:hypothetical protein
MNVKSDLLLSVEAYAGDSLSCSPDMWVFCPVTRQSKLVLVWLMAATTTWICSSAVDILSPVSVDTGPSALWDVVPAKIPMRPPVAHHKSYLREVYTYKEDCSYMQFIRLTLAW